MASIEALRQEVDAFVQARDWEKHQEPKSVILALMAEVGELAECFQWLPADRSVELVSEGESRVAVCDEIADVFIYILQLCTILGIDLSAETRRKLVKNEIKHPATKPVKPVKPIEPVTD